MLKLSFFTLDREIIRGRDKGLWFVIDVRKDQAGVNCFRSEPHKSTDRFVDTDLVFQQIYFFPMSSRSTLSYVSAIRSDIDLTPVLSLKVVNFDDEFI